MSNGDSSGTLGTPHKHLSAQILLQRSPPRHTGFLRKRGKRERMLENIKFAKSFFSGLMRWRQRFVIVTNGCMYVYASETASSPLSSFSLRGYNRLIVMESEPSPWTFRVASPDETFKTHYFACHSDEDRKIWMGAIREELLKANDLPDDRASAGSISSDLYGYLQKPVFDPKNEDDEGEESDDSDYDKIDEEELEKLKAKAPRRIPLPPTPDEYKEVVKPGKTAKKDKSNDKDDHDYVNRPKNLKPPKQGKPPKPDSKPKPKPNPKPKRTPSEAEYFFPENDREKALSILRAKQDKGTYLVRKSRAGENKVLAVITEDDIKEYKILSKDNKVTINNRDYYKSVEDLLVAYQKTPLPNRTTTLTRAFSTQDLHM